MIILQGLTAEELLEQLSTMIDKKWEEKEKQRSKTETVKYLTRSEVAELLKISPPTLHAWTKEGLLPSYKIGNRVLYKSTEIDKTLSGRKFKRYGPFTGF